MSLTLSALSTEYVRVRIVAYKAGAQVDPTADVVQMAFPAAGVAPASGDWKSASWETTADGQHYARCLVGPSGGAVSLTAGRYDIWVKIIDNPETPVIQSGQILIT